MNPPLVASGTTYPPAPKGARIRGVLWCGYKDNDGERYGAPKIFADRDGKTTLVWEGALREVLDPQLESDFRAACEHYGYEVSGDFDLSHVVDKCR